MKTIIKITVSLLITINMVTYVYADPLVRVYCKNDNNVIVEHRPDENYTDENKLEDLKNRLRPFFGKKLNPKDTDGIKNELNSLVNEINKL